MKHDVSLVTLVTVEMLDAGKGVYAYHKAVHNT